MKRTKMQKTTILPLSSSGFLRKCSLFSLFALLIVFTPSGILAETESYDAEYHTMHHILDGYSWDFFKFPGDDDYVKVELPRILWDNQNQTLDFFATTTSAIQNGNYLSLYEINNQYLDGELEVISGKLLVPQAENDIERLAEQIRNAEDDDALERYQDEMKNVIAANKPLDFSITVNVLYLFFACAILLLVFLTVAKRYKQNPDSAPKGIQSLLEPVILFVRDDIVRNNMPEKHYKKYLPLLLTFFFFIWVLNLLGLTPFAANVTGNISVTVTLALVTLLVIVTSATKDFWKHIFWMPGVPAPLKVIMMVVEIISLIAKPFALTIRLFAVITAGHIILVSLMALIFVFGDMGNSPLSGFLISPISVLFMLFIQFLELLVVTLQAYIFTLLSTVFIGQALEEHEHHDEKHEEIQTQQAVSS